MQALNRQHKAKTTAGWVLMMKNENATSYYTAWGGNLDIINTFNKKMVFQESVKQIIENFDGYSLKTETTSR